MKLQNRRATAGWGHQPLDRHAIGMKFDARRPGPKTPVDLHFSGRAARI